MSVSCLLKKKNQNESSFPASSQQRGLQICFIWKLSTLNHTEGVLSEPKFLLHSSDSHPDCLRRWWHLVSHKHSTPPTCLHSSTLNEGWRSGTCASSGGRAHSVYLSFHHRAGQDSSLVWALLLTFVTSYCCNQDIFCQCILKNCSVNVLMHAQVHSVINQWINGWRNRRRTCTLLKTTSDSFCFWYWISQMGQLLCSAVNECTASVQNVLRINLSYYHASF